MNIYRPKDWWTFTPAQIAEITNGCGSDSAKFDFVPDKILGLDISEACNVHDFMYAMAAPKEDERVKADTAFLYNMITIINAKTKNRLLLYLRRWVAKRYYLAVKYFGGPAFWLGK